MTGEELRAWMDGRYTVRGLAAELEIDPRTVSRWRLSGPSRFGELALINLGDD